MLSDNLSPNTLRPIFSHALTLKLETLKLDAFLQNYSQGQTLSGKVVQVLPEQKAVVELQGEKLLVQFPRPVTAGQHIAIKIEQIQPSPILKLTEFSSFASSPKMAANQLAPAAFPSNSQESDKTSVQNRAHDSRLSPSSPSQNAGPDAKSETPTQISKLTDPLSKGELKQIGIEVGQKGKAEVLRVVDRETVQVRLNDHTVNLKLAPSHKVQPGEFVSIQAKSLPAGKFVLEVEPTPPSSGTDRHPLELSVLKNYLPARQPLAQVMSGLKEVFLEGPLTPFKELNIPPGPLKQLQVNLQKIVSGELRTPDAVQLKEIVDRSGFHYEAKVRDLVLEPGSSNKNALLENDLKGQLMRLARQLEQLPAPAADHTASDKFMGKLAVQVNQAVSNIELQQLIHHFSKEQQHPLLLQLPENLLSEDDRFKIYILPDQREEESRKTNTQNRVFNLVFLLNFSALGDLRIETAILNHDISIQITGSNSAAVQFIQTHVPELENIFQEAGFSIRVTSRHEAEVSMEIPDGLGQLLVDTPLQLVDLKT